VKREHHGERIPSILFTKGGGGWLEAQAASGCDAVGVDWTVDLGAARRRIGQRVSLQGNLDPAVLVAGKNAVRAGTAAVLAAYGRGAGHVFNLGHGVTQFTSPDNVAALVEAVHELSPAYH
jgi:uroporphyrinogen decarboxylase